jgi:hypothetical protein
MVMGRVPALSFAWMTTNAAGTVPNLRPRNARPVILGTVPFTAVRPPCHSRGSGNPLQTLELCKFAI